VCIEHRRYDRNQFIFNLAIVLDEDADFSAHSSVVRKLASLFRNLEEQSKFLSKEEEDLFKHPVKRAAEGRIESPVICHDEELGVHFEHDDNGRPASLSNSLELGTDTSQATKVYAICEMIMEDLNNYCECMIPIGQSIPPLYERARLTVAVFRRCEHNQSEVVPNPTAASSSLCMACSPGNSPTYEHSYHF
jgi:nitrogen permease regulator 2-like protein